MQVTLEKTSALEGLIKVEVAENDYLPKVNKELKEIGRTRQIPGFRPGHVSLEQLRRRFGKEVKSHVLNEEVFNAVINYLRENKVDILGEPLPVKVEEINLDDKDYTFSYEVALAPEFDVDLNKDMHVPYYTIEDTIPYGHGEKSVMMITEYIKLTVEEKYCIRWHMGFTEPKEVYSTLGQAFKKFPLALLLHEADLEASYFFDI